MNEPFQEEDENDETNAEIKSHLNSIEKYENKSQISRFSRNIIGRQFEYRVPSMQFMQPSFPIPLQTQQTQILIQSYSHIHIINENINKVRELYAKDFNLVAEEVNVAMENSTLSYYMERDWFLTIIKALNKEKRSLEQIMNRLITSLKDGSQTEQILSNIVPESSEMTQQFLKIYFTYKVVGKNMRLLEKHYDVQKWLVTDPHRHRFNLRPPLISTEALITPVTIRKFKISFLNSTDGESRWKKTLKELRWDFRKFGDYSEDFIENVMNGDFPDIYLSLDYCPRFGSTSSLLTEMSTNHQNFVVKFGERDQYLNILGQSFSLPNDFEAWIIIIQDLLDLITSMVEISEFRNRIFEINNIRKNYYIMERRGYVPKIEYPDIPTEEIHEVRHTEISNHYFDYRDKYNFLDAWRLSDGNGQLIPEMVELFKRRLRLNNEFRHRLQ